MQKETKRMPIHASSYNESAAHCSALATQASVSTTALVTSNKPTFLNFRIKNSLSDASELAHALRSNPFDTPARLRSPSIIALLCNALT